MEKDAMTNAPVFTCGIIFLLLMQGFFCDDKIL